MPLIIIMKEIKHFLLLNSASGCPIAAKNKGKSGYEGISSLSKYGPSSSTFGAFDQSTEHMMVVDDKDKNRMDTSDGMDEKVPASFKLSIFSHSIQILFIIYQSHNF